MTRFENTDDLLGGILAGKVPRQVRLFAAQGLLPIPQEDLLRLQVMLSTDPDDELAKIATTSVEEMDAEAIGEWVSGYDLEPMVLDLVIRLREEDSIWVAVASHAAISDETLRILAKNGSTMVQDIIITNQVRVLGCLEILDDLRTNTQVNQVVLRRVREFEEEFIEKVLSKEDLGGDKGPSVEEAIEALHFIGAHIPQEDAMPYPQTEDQALEEAVNKSTQEAHARLLKMSVHERIVCALRGSREERAILINSRNRLVQRSVLACPKLSDNEVEQFAASRSVAEEVIKAISANRRWLRNYPVVIALAMNPKTPVYTAKSLIPRLNYRDRVRVSRDRNLSPTTRQIATKMLDTRR